AISSQGRYNQRDSPDTAKESARLHRAKCERRGEILGEGGGKWSRIKNGESVCLPTPQTSPRDFSQWLRVNPMFGLAGRNTPFGCWSRIRGPMILNTCWHSLGRFTPCASNYDECGHQ